VNARTDEGACGGATTLLRATMGGKCSLDLAFARLGKRGRGKRERRKGGAGLGCVPGGAARCRRHYRPRAPGTRATSPSFLCKRTRGGKGKEKGKQRREGSVPRPNAVRRSLDLAVAGRSPGRSLRPPPPVCCERCVGERKGLGFAGGCQCRRWFCSCETHGQPSDLHLR
jgi:hypothetical protein